MIEKLLQEPFPSKDIEWRVQATGEANGGRWARVLAYVDARAVMDRLDQVFGAMNWKDNYHHMNENVLCTIEVYHDGRTASKQDGSPETQVESFKGGISKAFVRCAVKWGIGRYLYELGENYANCISKEEYKKLSDIQKQNYLAARDAKTKTSFYFCRPELPYWALSQAEKVKCDLRGLIKNIGVKQACELLSIESLAELDCDQDYLDAYIQLSEALPADK